VYIYYQGWITVITTFVVNTLEVSVILAIAHQIERPKVETS
jgi:hypothetical protein